VSPAATADRGPETAPRGPRTLGEALVASASTRGSLVLVEDGDRETSLSFGELLGRARRAAGTLVATGIAPGDRVAIVAPTGLGFLDAFFGAVLAGAVPVPLYPPVRLGRLRDYHDATATMLERVGARVVVAEPRVRLLLGETLSRARPALGSLSTEGLAAGRDEALVAARPDDLGLIQFSSGSTASPRPVALSHRALVAQCEALPALFSSHPAGENIGCSWLPLYHDMGLIGGLLTAIHHGGKLVLLAPERFLVKPGSWLRAIGRHRATVSPAPNFAYALCEQRVRDEEMAGVDLSSWQHALCGAEPVSPAVLRRFAQRFARFGFHPGSLMPVYGMSEASLAVSYAPRGRALRTVALDAAVLARSGEVVPGERELASVGIPVPGSTIEIRDEHGQPLADNQIGRIFIGSTSLMDGYFGDPEATARVLAGGMLDTGDLGFLREGELYIAGRAKDVVIVRGANHAPQEFEAPLDHLDGVRPGCAVALGFLPPGADGEELLLLIERASGRPAAGDSALADAARTAVMLATSIRPHTIEILAPGTLPRTSSGKLRRREALARYLAGALTSPEEVGPALWARELVRSAAGYVRARLPE
jgi:acyl-CoA synthetase (AMP-forming)/AMP-acid ligase II